MSFECTKTSIDDDVRGKMTSLLPPGSEASKHLVLAHLKHMRKRDVKISTQLNGSSMMMMQELSGMVIRYHDDKLGPTRLVTQTRGSLASEQWLVLSKIVMRSAWDAHCGSYSHGPNVFGVLLKLASGLHVYQQHNVRPARVTHVNQSVHRTMV